MIFVLLLATCICSQASAVSYKLTIKTSDKNFAGTDAKVYVELYGDKGETGRLFVGDSQTNSNSFERLQKADVFTVNGAYVGKITKMKIGHDNSGRSAAWHVKDVSVKVGACTTTFSVWRWLYSSRLNIDVFPTLEEGNCNSGEVTFGNDGGHDGGNGRSEGSICVRNFRKVGCFKRDWANHDLVITDLDPEHEKTSKKMMNWADYALGLHSLACRCRDKAAAAKYKYFGIGFYGECAGGKDNKELEKMMKATGDKEAGGCVNGEWTKCVKDHEKECAGEADFDFFYEILD